MLLRFPIIRFVGTPPPSLGVLTVFWWCLSLSTPQLLLWHLGCIGYPVYLLHCCSQPWQAESVAGEKNTKRAEGCRRGLPATVAWPDLFITKIHTQFILQVKASQLPLLPIKNLVFSLWDNGETEDLKLQSCVGAFALTTVASTFSSSWLAAACLERERERESERKQKKS